jgi:hypothetical protein
MRVLELFLCSNWGITDELFLQTSKRVLPVQKQMDQILDVLLSSLRRENTIARDSLSTLESTVSSMAIITDHILRASIDNSSESTSDGSIDDEKNIELGEEGGVDDLRRSLATEDVRHGIIRLSSLSTLMITVLEQHHHALSISSNNAGDDGDGSNSIGNNDELLEKEDGGRISTSSILNGMNQLIESHRSMHDEILRTNEKLEVGRKVGNNIRTNNKSSEISELSEQIGTCRTRLARVIDCLEEATPGVIEELNRVMYITGGTDGNSDENDSKQPLPSCVDLHKSVRERFSMIVTNIHVKELSQVPSTLKKIASSNTMTEPEKDSCPAFERQARLLREKITTAAQLEQDQKALKKTLAKRIQEVYMKQRELDTVGVRCEKLKQKVIDSQQHIDAAKAETAQLKQDAVRESKHFEEAVDELNRDVDRLEAENRRLRKQLDGSSSSSPLRRDESQRRRRRGSDLKRTTDQIKREWRTDAKEDKNNTDETDTSISKSTANQSTDLVSLRRTLNYVAAENVRLKTMVVQRRMQRMTKLSTFVNYKAAQVFVAEESKEYKETKEFESKSNESAPSLRMKEHVRIIRACNAEATRLSNQIRMRRAKRTLVDLSLTAKNVSKTKINPSMSSISSNAWSALSQRCLENAQARQSYHKLAKKVKVLARVHSAELGHAPKDFGSQNYSLLPIKDLGRNGVGMLKTGKQKGGRVVRVPMSASALNTFHKTILQG